MYLNVFVPERFLAPADANDVIEERHFRVYANEKLPVMIWLYGGNFRNGGGTCILYDGRFLAHFGDVIVVTPNYRYNFLEPDDKINKTKNSEYYCFSINLQKNIDKLSMKVNLWSLTTLKVVHSIPSWLSFMSDCLVLNLEIVLILLPLVFIEQHRWDS